ncbi:choice-of-anchor L domain-containing protein [Flavobacterium cyanobacteriorum]|nr:choice-of-anchor L domain-containing protein [Flavobacterium cyanobacteriorum]
MKRVHHFIDYKLLKCIHCKLYLFGIAWLYFISSALSAQNIIVNQNFTAQQLAETLVDGSCAQVSNVSLQGRPGFGSKSHGYFTSAANFPFSSGILLSSGFAEAAQGPNTTIQSEGTVSWGGDEDLELALDINDTNNATVLEFDFVPFTNNISFQYIFASEEYTDFQGEVCNYSDGFAFLLKQVGAPGDYQNLAVIPGTTIPVKVTTVRGTGSTCPPANPEFFGSFNSDDSPTNFNGQTQILTAEAQVTAGLTYHIKLVIADQGDTLYDSAIFLAANSFASSIELGPDRLLLRNNPLCEGEQLALDATTPGAAGYQWFKDGAALDGEINPAYTVNSPGLYRVEVQLGTTCFAKGEIQVEYAAVPQPGAYTLSQCDDNTDGITIFNLTQADQQITGGNASVSVSYYRTLADATAQINAIAGTGQYQNTSANETVYARALNRYGCFTISTVLLTTSTVVINAPSPLIACDEDGTDDGVAQFDLTLKNSEILQGQPAGLQVAYFATLTNALLSQNPLTAIQYRNTVPGTQTIYARVNNAGSCYDVVPVELIVDVFEALPPEEKIVCADNIITLYPGVYTSYSWNTDPVQNTPSVNVTLPGTYTVTLTNSNGCRGTKTYTVSASGPATGAAIDIIDFAGSNNSISITPTGTGNYEYSLDGIHYQPEPFFEGLGAGDFKIYIKDINGCEPIYNKVVYVLDYPRFFTPNGDGVNDYWRIPFLQTRPDAEVTVFDRFGKLIQRFGSSSRGWDGTYNGTPLPSTDYWFVLKLGNGRTIKGHFSMLR